MSCDRCKDIHKAQIEGRTQRACGCSCHDKFYSTGTDTGTSGTLSVTTTGTDLLFNTSTAGATTDVSFAGQDTYDLTTSIKIPESYWRD